MADAAPHVVHPTIPVWAINLALSVLIAALWPIGWLLDQYMDPYFLRIIVLIGINVILATGLNLVNGITGQFSLAHQAWMETRYDRRNRHLRHIQSVVKSRSFPKRRPPHLPSRHLR